MTCLSTVVNSFTATARLLTLILHCC